MKARWKSRRKELALWGAMESNQRHVTFRMKRRGMHWSTRGAEAMVKIKQGLLNQTLRAASESASTALSKAAAPMGPHDADD